MNVDGIARRVVRRFHAAAAEGETTDTPDARLAAIRRRAQLMLRRLADPKFETEEMLAAFAWIVGIADGTAPLP